MSTIAQTGAVEFSCASRTKGEGGVVTRILAFSDWRVHDMRLVDEALDLVGPVDAILYAGDDTERFGLAPITDALEAESLAGPAHPPTLVPPVGTRLMGIRWGWALGVAVRFDGEGRDAAARVLGRVFRELCDGENGIAIAGGAILARLLFRFGTFANVGRAVRRECSFHERNGVGVFLWPFPRDNHFERFAARTRYGLGAVLGNDCRLLDRLSLRGAGVHDLHSTPWRVGRLDVIGLQGVPRGGLGDVTYSEKEGSDHLRRSAASVGRSQPLIVVSHAPPYGVLDYSMRFGNSHVGSRALRGFVEERRPLVVLCGHSHLSGGAEKHLGPTLIVNVANHDSPNTLARFALLEIGSEVSIRWILPQREGVRALIQCGPRREEALAAAGLRRYPDVLARPVEEVARAGRVPLVIAGKWKKHALAMTERRFIPLQPRTVPFREPCLFYDLETRPFNSKSRQIWLIGFRFGRRGRVHQLLARNPRDEKTILSEFLSIIGKHADEPLVCWAGSTDFDHVYLAARVRKLLPHKRSVLARHPKANLGTYVRQHALPPSAGYSLKEVGGAIGLTKEGGIDGLAAGMAYERWLEEGEEPDWKGLLAYNANDVKLMALILEEFERAIPLVPVMQQTGVGPQRNPGRK